jgi:hypothetical protein
VSAALKAYAKLVMSADKGAVRDLSARPLLEGSRLLDKRERRISL